MLALSTVEATSFIVVDLNEMLVSFSSSIHHESNDLLFVE